jgi:hypothetical protein
MQIAAAIRTVDDVRIYKSRGVGAGSAAALFDEEVRIGAPS